MEKHYEAAKCLAAKCLAAKCLAAKCPAAKCLAAKCPATKCLAAKCLAAKCLAAKCLAAKCLAAKCPATKCLGADFSSTFVHLVEPGIVQIRTRGTINRFGEAGPLVDGVVVSLTNLPSFIRNTILNTSRRDVAEIENYTFPHTRRKQSIVEFAKKYAGKTSYEEFLVNVIQN
ncbi:hypothetical protein L3Y34_017424 [Caenorhabditis briggsae]|uniref:Uncharacterized protein n=1 Tax=Caenorhabditis briggsae TaxID=6238 RepID=A0AAE9DIF2_CAEBR|nr:hypothetical protein L3Y34_017424 [Caenorhabditis briggsae]